MSDKTVKSKTKEVLNSFTGFVSGLAGFNGAQLSKADTMNYNLRRYLISMDRQLLSWLYVEHGIVQTLIDQPVDDAFATGFEIKTGELSADEIEKLENAMERMDAVKTIGQASKWARTFGGGGILILTDQKPDTPLDITKLDESSNLEFRAVDMWELTTGEGGVLAQNMDTYIADVEYFMYYGKRIHCSRVMPIKGKEAPSFVRPQLRGWGMSEIERLVRSISQYMKNQDVIFELLDEAKVDVYKIEGFNSAMLTASGTEQITKRIQLGNQAKNFLNAIVMDAGDEYEQKHMNFAGLSETLGEIRMQVAADLKMPMTKLFGISASGFNSGEDDIENYNSMVNSEVRAKVKFLVVDVVGMLCQKMFGYVPDDLTIEWHPLRQLTSKEEEEVKNSQFNRSMASYQSGAISRKEFAESVNKNSLLPVEIDESDEDLPPIDGQFLVGSQDNVDA
jgi:phage-related protein (TIGR01555 family)